jgi:hypothetical protein
MIEDPAPGLLVVRGTALLARFPDPRIQPDCSPRYYARDRQASRQPGFSEVFAAAHLIVAWLRASEVEAYGIVSRAMLKLYHDTWSDEPPISAEEFTVRIELVNVSMPSDGNTFILWFTDGEMEMFGGHIIEASFGADYQPRSAHRLGEAHRRTIRCSRLAGQDGFSRFNGSPAPPVAELRRSALLVFDDEKFSLLIGTIALSACDPGSSTVGAATTTTSSLWYTTSQFTEKSLDRSPEHHSLKSTVLFHQCW